MITDGLQAVGRRARLQQLQRRRRRIDAGDFGRARLERAQPPGAEIAENVEHARAADVFAQGQPIRGLVEEPAGFLAAAQRHLEAHAALFHDHELGRVAEHGLDVVGQPFQIAHAGVVLPHQRRRIDDLFHRRFDLRPQRLHARGGDLPDDHVAEAIQHQARQRIGLAVHQSIERLVVERVAQRLRDLQAMHDQRLVGRVMRAAPQDSRADQRVRIHIGIAQEFVAIGDDPTQRAGLEGRQRRAGGVHFVGKHPQVASG